MKYQHDLEPLINWVASHPGLTQAQLKRTICDALLPSLPTAVYRGGWVPPIIHHVDPYTPGSWEITWKLRYLELAGKLRQDERHRWYIVEGD